MEIIGGVYVYSVLMPEPTEEYDEVKSEVSECEDHQSASNPRARQAGQRRDKKHFNSQDIKGLKSLGQMAVSNTGRHKWRLSIECHGLVWYDTLRHGLVLFHLACDSTTKNTNHVGGLCVGYISTGHEGREPIVREPYAALSMTAYSFQKNFSRQFLTRREAHTLRGHWSMTAGLPGSCARTSST